mgnify:CR=1 FL=1
MSYKRSKYFITRSKRKIKYLLSEKNSAITVVFFHGFMSDMIGAKPKEIQKFCNKNNLNFLKFEYSGHGKSTGEFTKGNISKWTNEAKELISSKLKEKNKLIFIGSSMGSWISLNLFPIFKKRLKGFIGIGSAPEFLENLMWKKFTKKMKEETIKNGIYHLKHGDYEYPITLQLIKDGRKNKVLNKKYDFNIPVIMIHGTEDEVVPVRYSRKIIKIFRSKYKKLLLIKKGDHSLSEKKFLRKINHELYNIIKKLKFN